MGLFYRLSLLAILLTTFTIVHAYERKSLGRPQRVGRFNSKASITRSNIKLNLTEAEAHARWLTSRKPTRRSTAERRQVSDTPSGSDARLAAQDDSTGASVGNLVFTTNGWSISSTEDGSTITYSRTLAARDTRDAQRLVYSAPDASYPYKYFGVGQCNIGSSTTIGPGSSNVLCLVNSESPTRAGALPTLIKNNFDTSGSSYVETDIWNLDASTQTAAPMWINSDGRSVPAYIVSAINNPSIIYVTGDVDATAELYGIQFRKLSLKYTNLY
ncbi:hypothetical protein BDN70DRAFT_877841 [Pholiota conissans]|uniref:Uncharacterized protein n=1 Tax=Pholiota conissans TaxID=109636 RepID=A0A9P6CV21_9AGAR|nr:hypothetical protein BDN70DRAFT_877841 [Pholiota conissans]